MIGTQSPPSALRPNELATVLQALSTLGEDVGEQRQHRTLTDDDVG